MVKLNQQYINKFVNQEEILNYQKMVNVIDQGIKEKNLIGSDFLGWNELPYNYNQDELEKIKTVSEKIKKESDILLVIGIGGSYLGAKAIIEMLNLYTTNEIEIIFVGQTMSSNYLNSIIKKLENKDFSINVISKSGTTLEPALSFRLFKKILIDKYGIDEANKRIYATTDKEKGLLKKQADKYNWETFIVPDDIGGRFSVLTPVGLLPICVSGINIDDLIDGSKQAYDDLKNPNIEQNDAYKYAVIRRCLVNKGYDIEMLVTYEPNLIYLNEWYKQLFAESEGKNNSGIFPTSGLFSTDLHSIGQYIQEGKRNIFETVIKINEFDLDLVIPNEDDNLDELNYLSGKKFSFANNCAMEGTINAHVDGGVPNLVLNLDKLTPMSVGYLIYFFYKVVSMSGYLQGINPFNQPGVEAYKKNMFNLLKE